MGTFLSILVTLLLLPAARADSHPLTASWSRAFGDTDNQLSSNSATDSSGNIFLSGHFIGEIDLGGGPLVCSLKDDVYLAKFDPDGNHLWSRSFGDYLWQHAYGVAVDPAGNVIIVGAFTGTVDFGGGPLISTGLYIFDIYIAKFDTDGNHVWSRSFGGTGDDFATALCVDDNGEITIAGDYMLPFSIDGSYLPNFGYQDFFVAAFTADGVHKWSWGRGGSAMDICGDIALDRAGNLLIAGEFAETIDFGEDPVTAVGERDVFLAKYDRNGAHLWSRQFVGNGVVGLWGIGVSACEDSSAFLCGAFSDQIDLGSGVLTSAGGFDVYLARIDQNGTTLWSNAFGDAEDQITQGGVTTIDGTDVVMTVSSVGDIDFGGGPLTGQGLFMARLDQAGTHVWSQVFGGRAYSRGGVGADTAGRLVMTGGFTGSMDFGNGPLVSAGEYDIFLTRFDLPVSSVDIVPDPRGLELSVHPNPFNPSTTISFAVPQPARVSLNIYDLSGRLVRTLRNGEVVEAGHHEAVWRGRDDAGRAVASGVYMYRLEAGDYAETKRMALIK